jgi:hypothetical protein
MQHLFPNSVLQLAGFVIVCEAFLGIEPNKDLFRRLFEVKSRWALGSADGVLAPMGGMNIQMRSGVSHLYLCLLLRSLNSGWHGGWFYICDDTSATLLPFSVAPPESLAS